MIPVALKPTLTIAIAGSIASGKTTLCKNIQRIADNSSVLLQLLNYDYFRRGILSGVFEESSLQVKSHLFSEFGSEVINSNNNIHYLRVAEIIFSDAAALNTFNNIIDPFILDEMRKAVISNVDVILVEWPCIIERGLLSFCHNNVILVQCRNELRMQRLCSSDLSEEQVKRRINLQASDAQRYDILHSIKYTADDFRNSYFSENHDQEEISQQIFQKILIKLNKTERALNL
jgi:dephospho-CoA kinase